MTNTQHLLVPLQVQALVIDNLVIDKKPIAKITDQRNVSNDGRWSPLGQDYNLLINGLGVPGPKPFYGARRTFGGRPTDQLVLESFSTALPKMEDRGVYLHWVLPSGLRRSYKVNSLEFPALPDQWLIVRYSRRGADLQTKAWFVDSGLMVDSNGPANLLFPAEGKYEARTVGKVVPLDQFNADDFKGERTTITAIGNAPTGSPTFTAYVAENRNVLSWSDDLNDLRDATKESRVPKDIALSYQVLGWYHDQQNEPLSALTVNLTDGNLLEPLGWLINSDSGLPGNLRNRRCIFHGMVAHINYWNSGTYQGTMLGYPGAPSVEGVLGKSPPSFKVGVGNNAEDAFVSLVSSEYSGGDKAPNLWKALEAVIYRQPESLAGSWNTAPRDHTVHQSWFSTFEAGRVWDIRPRPDDKGAFPANPATTAAQTTAKPTPENLAALKQINELQSAADATGRELAALQQDLYARWWKLCELSRRDETANLDNLEEDCRTLIARVSAVRSRREGLVNRLRPLPETVPEPLAKTLSKELELRSDSAPRFWSPADPVIVVKNCGLPTKHQFPPAHPCRLSEQVVTSSEVTVEKKPRSFNTAAGIDAILEKVKNRFASRSEILTDLLTESSIVEQAITDLVERTLPSEKRFFSADNWQTWAKRLVDDLTAAVDPKDQIKFGNPGRMKILPHSLVSLWAQQPWSPLFLDWQITYMPTANSDHDFGKAWILDKHDYKPVNRESIPDKGFTVRGRSLLSPIDGRIFNKPIEILRDMLKGKRTGAEKADNTAFPKEVAEILSRYEDIWDKTLFKLSSGGLMGQSLTGFHQTLVNRDVTLPRVMPDGARPWIAEDVLKSLDSEVRALLDSPNEAALIGERLAPPAPTNSGNDSFMLTRAGAFKLDELWLVDDFGQWADLLGGTSAGGSFGAVFNPRVRWHDDQFVVAMPPRVVQPTRLNFRFTSADDHKSESDGAHTAICGWIFYNPLDNALTVCEKNGRLAGELVITEEGSGFRVNWDAGTHGVPLNKIRNSSLKDFAGALIETKPTRKPKLHQLLQLIDYSLERIRPAAARRDASLFGRPLALVSATLGFELFGKAWTDPQKRPSDPPVKTGNPMLDALKIPVNLGCSHSTEDGLIGYFKENVFDSIVPPDLPEKIKAEGYIADPKKDAVRIGFGSMESVALLMDPWGGVQAATGLVPAKTITLAQDDLGETLARMEASFRVGPVLLQSERLSLPTPASEKGKWNFAGPLTSNSAVSIVPSDPHYFSDKPVIAAEGRLLLVNTEE